MEERIIHVPLNMKYDELIKLFREGDHYISDPDDPKRRNLVSEYRDYVFEIEKQDGTIFSQKIEKYPFIYYLIRDPDTNKYFAFDTLAEYLLSKR